MSRISWLVASALVVACSVGADATLINFEDLSNGVFAGDRYRDLGVMLSTDGDFLRAEPSQWAHSSMMVIYGSVISRALGDVIVDFVLSGTNSPGMTDAVSFYVCDGDAPDGTWSASIYDPNGDLLDLVSGTANAIQISFSRPTGDIHRMVFSPSPDAESMDDLAFGPIVPVPEPGMLLVLGTLGLPLIHRWRRR